MKDRQFCDAGSPYRTAIFVHDAGATAKPRRRRRRRSRRAKPFKEPIVTEIALAGPFYAAEDYHQDYYKKNPVRYKYYRTGCGREARLKQLWGDKAGQYCTEGTSEQSCRCPSQRQTLNRLAARSRLAYSGSRASYRSAS